MAEINNGGKSNPDCAMIGEGVVFEGSIDAAKQVSIYGKVRGRITADEVFTGTASDIVGHMEANTAVVSGRFDHELVAKKQLVVKSTAHLTGTLLYESIEIERGGQVYGSLGNTSAGFGNKAEPVQAQRPAPVQQAQAPAQAPAAPAAAPAPGPEALNKP